VRPASCDVVRGQDLGVEDAQRGLRLDASLELPDVVGGVAEPQVAAVDERQLVLVDQPGVRAAAEGPHLDVGDLDVLRLDHADRSPRRADARVTGVDDLDGHAGIGHQLSRGEQAQDACSDDDDSLLLQEVPLQIWDRCPGGPGRE
jgi:hypothetical protein